MRRSAFLGGACALAAVPRRVGAAPERIDLSATVANIPAVTGVVVRTLNPAQPPLVSVRPDEEFYAASIIKLGIMLALFRAYDAGLVRPSDTVRTRADDLIGGSDVLTGHPAGEAWRLDTLVGAMIRVSDNAAANTLISTLGIDVINREMHRAGMTRSHLARKFSDSVPPGYVSKNVVTPRDIATLLFGIEHGAREGFSTVASVPACRGMLQVLLTNDDDSKIARGLPRGTPVAHKTGEIDGTRNDGAVVDPFGDTPYVIVALTRDVRDTSAANAGIAAIARRVDAVVRS